MPYFFISDAEADGQYEDHDPSSMSQDTDVSPALMCVHLEFQRRYF